MSEFREMVAAELKRRNLDQEWAIENALADFFRSGKLYIEEKEMALGRVWRLVTSDTDYLNRLHDENKMLRERLDKIHSICMGLNGQVSEG